MLTNGRAGFDDLYKILSPVLNRWSFKENTEVVVLTLEDPKDLGFIIVLLVKSSYSTWYEVVIPGVKDIETLSFCNNPWFSLHTTVPTTLSIKPVISSFWGLKLCLTPVPWLLKKSCRPVVPIPVTAPVDPIPIGFSDNPKKFFPSLIA